jgi:hypothetical protein
MMFFSSRVLLLLRKEKGKGKTATKDNGDAPLLHPKRFGYYKCESVDVYKQNRSFS